MWPCNNDKDKTINVNLNLGGTVTLAGTIGLVISPLPPAPQPIRSVVTSRVGTFSTKVETDHMAYNLPLGMEVGVSIAYVDKGGNPASVDGAVTWSSSNDSMVAVTPQADDGSVAIIMTQGSTLGTAQITATADADLGAGVKNILTLFDVAVVAGEAIAGTISPTGDPTDIPVSRRK